MVLTEPSLVGWECAPPFQHAGGQFPYRTVYPCFQAVVSQAEGGRPLSPRALHLFAAP